jgi:cardiolipin synthase
VALHFSDAFTWGSLYYLAEWAIRLVMLVVVPFRRTPEAARGWLLLIFILPFAGLPLFWVLGRYKWPRWRLVKQEEFQQRMLPVIERLQSSPNIQHPHLGEHLDQAVLLAENLGHMPILGGNSAEMLTDYAGTIDRLIADIDQAQDHAHLLFYIFADDDVGCRVAEALARAARRGVRCRVLMDAVGTGRRARRMLPRLHKAGIAAYAMLRVGLFRRRRSRFDQRNHRKIAVIDGRIAYTGSQNIVNPDFKEGLTFEEAMVRVTGPIALTMQYVFANDWFLETDEVLDAPALFPDPEQTGRVPMQTLPSGPGFPLENNQRMFLTLMHAARQRIVITTPYFVPDLALLQALQTAVLRGVDVHLVVNQRRDQVLVSLGQRSYYDELLEAGVQIHLHRARFLHAKHLTIDDDVTLIGSSNMDIRSFQLNAEISLLMYDGGITREVQRMQQHYFTGSDMLTLEEWRSRPWSQQVLENLARLISPLL